MNMQIQGPYCPVSSHLQDLRIPWVPAEQTDVAVRFAREIAKMRSPYYESSYDETDRDHHLMFVGGFKK